MAGPYKYVDPDGAARLAAKVDEKLDGKLSLDGSSVFTGDSLYISKTVSGDQFVDVHRAVGDVEHTIRFGIGSSNINRGIWDVKQGKWILLMNDSGNSFAGTADSAKSLTTTNPVSKGGTGATTASQALANLGAYSKTEVDKIISDGMIIVDGIVTASGTNAVTGKAVAEYVDDKLGEVANGSY